ncbi:DUF1707 and DUF4190 domain-containing protein [Streptacidiphilus sp. NEAU-YB345]|uniref:DUF1707 and DUF4190 domain-containing protein n=2 Tax=Streptacidiphilus fuscans TaxID=2789292 RepID=A0A931FD98_9ACTN|nr:DUF1707 and DUF4190 domain-containing protein [Streptacidiphilus fuscans]
MRAAQADRERTVDVLKAAFAEGRLSSEEYAERVGAAQSAQTYGQLAVLVQDLPVGPMPTPMSSPMPSAFAVQPGPPYVYPGPPAAYAPPYWPPRPRRTNGAAVASLLLGLAQVFTMGLTGLPALVTGIIAKSQLRDSHQDGSGMATAGIVLGSMGTGLWVLLILLGVTHP